jgi:hypothetical protein
MAATGRRAIGIAVLGIWIAALGAGMLGSLIATERVLRAERELFAMLVRLRRAQLSAYFEASIEESRHRCLARAG